MTCGARTRAMTPQRYSKDHSSDSPPSGRGPDTELGSRTLPAFARGGSAAGGPEAEEGGALYPRGARSTRKGNDENCLAYGALCWRRPGGAGVGARTRGVGSEIAATTHTIGRS
jgi:hypothetical protein